MSIQKTVAAVSAASAAVTSAALSLTFGFSLAAAPVAAIGGGIGAAAASVLTMGVVSSLCDGKGTDAGIAGLFGMMAGHAAAVPVAAGLAAKLALSATGFLPG